MSEIIEACKVCGQPRLIRRDGRDISKICNCGRNTMSKSKLNQHVGLNFHHVNMSDWNPKPLADDETPLSFMKYQKSLALIMLWNMYYKEDKNGSFEISKSVLNNRNLFIRAPDGCGKGMMAATAKKLSCALSKRDEFIEMSPVADDFGSLKRWLFIANMFSEGQEAREQLERFTQSEFMVLQDVTVENIFRDKEPYPIKNSVYLDGIISGQQQHGCLMVTSKNFIGEIRGHLGSVIEDVLLSTRTALIILLLGPEVSEIEKGIEDLKRKYTDYLRLLRKTEEDNHISSIREEQRIQELESVFYFMHAFSSSGRAEDNIHLLENVQLKGHDYPPWVIQAYTQFCEDRENKTPTYQKLLDEAFRLGVQESRFGKRMSPKEAIFTGKMISRFKDKKFVEKICLEAETYKETML